MNRAETEEKIKVGHHCINFMQNSRTNLIFGILIGFLVLTALLFAILWYQAKSELRIKNQELRELQKQIEELKQKQAQEEQGEGKSEIIDTSTWKTYRNEQYGVEFLYPPYFVLTEHGATGPGGAYYSIALVKGGNVISVILDQPMSAKDIAEACVVGAENVLKTFIVPAGMLKVCTGEHGGVVFYGTHIPAQKPSYAHEVSASAGTTYKDQTLQVFEGLLSTFKFIK